MKFQTIFMILLLLSLVLSPLAAVSFPQEGGEEPLPGQVEEGGESIKVLNHLSGRVGQLSMEEYLVGAVAAEMNASCHQEALKAQAVACRSYALRKQEMEQQSPSKTLKGADISDDTAVHQGYINEQARQEKWGDNSEVYEKKLHTLVREVMDKTLCYEGKPILAAYHDISPGKTESAKEVWGEDYPYLQSVVSIGDKLSPNYSKTIVLTREQFAEKAKALDDVKLGKDSAAWLGEVKKSPAGIVKTIALGGTAVTGSEVRKAFGLPSAAFELSEKDGGFQFQTKGNGHGVGMSQYGADYMARQGSSWEEILKHYYAGVTIA